MQNRVALLTTESEARTQLFRKPRFPNALVSYKMTSTDTGHKDPALNATDHYGCLDTFVKRKGQWYAVGNACSLSEPLPQAEWNAEKKAMGEMPKDVQQAYH